MTKRQRNTLINKAKEYCYFLELERKKELTHAKAVREQLYWGLRGMLEMVGGDMGRNKENTILTLHLPKDENIRISIALQVEVN